MIEILIEIQLTLHVFKIKVVELIILLKSGCEFSLGRDIFIKFLINCSINQTFIIFRELDIIYLEIN